MALVICTKAKSGKGTNTAKSSGGNNGTNLNAKRSNTTQGLFEVSRLFKFKNIQMMSNSI